ncbi:MAG: MTH1187 family thiamine-binding protein [Thermodesulfobacteriota bacterium]
MTTLAELSIFPLDKGVSLGPYVARVLEVIKRSGLEYQLGPMGTCLQGDFAEVMQTVQECYQELEKDCQRIYLTLKMDCRQDSKDPLRSKVRSVEERL